MKLSCELRNWKGGKKSCGSMFAVVHEVEID